MTVHLEIAPETARILEDKAARTGQTLEAYLQELIDREAREANGTSDQAALDMAEFERGIEELSEGLHGLPSLPADFSRADIYGEHA